MKRIMPLFIIIFGITALIASESFCAEKVLYSFEERAQGWVVPDWACGKNNYNCNGARVSDRAATGGRSSLALNVDLPANNWGVALVEVEQNFDWTGYKTLSCDVYLPGNAPSGITAKLVFTEGTDLLWMAMAKPVTLTPGAWKTVSGNISPGSMDWIRGMIDKDGKVTRTPASPLTAADIKNVKKIAVSIESDRKDFEGSIYLDTVKISTD